MSTSVSPLIHQVSYYKSNVWESNDKVLNCRRCSRWFSLFTRRHHCRKCGQIICDKCSTNRALLSSNQIILPPNMPTENLSDLSSQPQRICDPCVDILVFENSADNQFVECPVCNATLIHLNVKNQEKHVQNCLEHHQYINYNQYVAYKLADPNSILIGQECAICFEEFEKDDIVTRLNCMCSYHRNCINSWFSKGKDCPIHSQ